jgi:aminoglycoside phosphotransferase (APT) family kinase protein
LFNYTSGRWIYNEKQQLEARRIDFSVPALTQAATETLGVSNVFDISKLPEGLFNRAFLLSHTEGAEVIARLPTSLAGPEYYTTASEVATLRLVRALGIPVPKVLAYSCVNDTDVGCEYILMEPAKGIPLLTVWDEMGRKKREKLSRSSLKWIAS